MLGGSASPSLSLEEIISLSSDPDSTKAAFDFNKFSLGLPSIQGKAELRDAVASTYDRKLSGITAENIIIANGTSGANHIVYRALLKPGDHVIVQYPTYSPLIQEPIHIGCEISYLRLNPLKSWQPDLEELQRLIKPGVTKLLILNNPSNPTGTPLETQTQREIVKIAKQHNLTIHCDEIFRPLFYADGPIPTSMVEHFDTFPDFDRIVTTSSLSKAYGLSGVRIGWIATRSPEMFQRFIYTSLYTMLAVSSIDELIATEVLGPRCRPGILKKHHALAKRNIDLIQAFVDKNHTFCEWSRPTAGAVGFVKFRDPNTGDEIDDVTLCQELLDKKKVLLSPGSLCFEFPQTSEASPEFKGRVRVHFTTTTENLQNGLNLIDEFLNDKMDIYCAGRTASWC